MSIPIVTATAAREAQQRLQDCVPTVRPIDYEHLNRYTLGDKDLENEILKLFAKQLPQHLQKLRDAAAHRNMSVWLEVTHALKGAAQAVGATVLAEHAAAAEQAAGRCSQFDMSELAAAIATVSAHVAQIAGPEVAKR